MPTGHLFSAILNCETLWVESTLTKRYIITISEISISIFTKKFND